MSPFGSRRYVKVVRSEFPVVSLTLQQVTGILHSAWATAMTGAGLPSVSHQLLIAESFDGIEAGSLPGGVDAEDNAD
jgi:hypothetical protein